MADQIKMTIGLPEYMESVLTGVAEADRVTKTEYVRNLIEKDLRMRERQYRQLHRVFARSVKEVKRGDERSEQSLDLFDRPPRGVQW